MLIFNLLIYKIILTKLQEISNDRNINKRDEFKRFAQ